MRHAVWRAGVAACSAALLLSFAGCRARVGNEVAADSASGRPPAAGALSADTLRGIIVEVGSAPTSTLVLRGAEGGTVALHGASVDLLRRVVGLDVVVHGAHSVERDAAASPGGARVFDVERFIVRAADGIAAYDGILTVEAGRYSLALHDGRKVAVTNLPGALRTKQGGARVFLAGPLDRPPVSYGVILPAR